MKVKFLTELYIEVPDRFKNDIVENIKFVDKHLRALLFLNNDSVDDSRLSIDEMLVVDYEMLE